MREKRGEVGGGRGAAGGGEEGGWSAQRMPREGAREGRVRFTSFSCVTATWDLGSGFGVSFFSGLGIEAFPCVTATWVGEGELGSYKKQHVSRTLQ